MKQTLDKIQKESFRFLTKFVYGGIIMSKMHIFCQRTFFIELVNNLSFDVVNFKRPLLLCQTFLFLFCLPKSFPTTPSKKSTPCRLSSQNTSLI